MLTSGEIFRALKWNAAARILSQGLMWIVTVIVMRILSPGDYGLIGLAMVMNGFFYIFSDLGATQALIQRRSVDNALVREVYGLLILCNLLIYFFLFLIAPYFSHFFESPQLTPITRWLGLTIIVLTLGGVPSAILKRDLRFKPISLIDLLSLTIGSSTILVCALSGYGVWSLVAGTLVHNIINTSGLLVSIHFLEPSLRISPSFNFLGRGSPGIGSVLSFGSKSIASGILFYLSGNFDSFLIGKVLGKDSLGSYSVPFNLALSPANKIMALTNSIAFSAYSRIQDDASRIRNYFLEAISLASVIFFPICWGMSSVSSDLVQTFLGSKWSSSSPVLALVALAVPFRLLTSLVDSVLNGIGRPGKVLANTITSLVCTVVGSTLGMLLGKYYTESSIYINGLTGLCTGTLVSILISSSINLSRGLAIIDIRLSEVAKIYLSSMVPALTMYLAVYLASSGYLYAISRLSPPMRLGLEITLGAWTYIIASFLFNRRTFLRFITIVRRSIL